MNLNIVWFNWHLASGQLAFKPLPGWIFERLFISTSPILVQALLLTLLLTSASCGLSKAAAAPSGHGFAAAVPLRAEPVIAGVLSQIPSESVWRQDYANCILSALLHLNNKRRTFLSEREREKGISAT